MKVITFYKYIEIKKPEILRDLIKDKCNNLNLNGRILIAHEGINASVCGDNRNIENFKDWIKNEKLFNDLTFREQEFKEQVHHKLVVKVRKEVVAFGENVNLEDKGDHIEPEKLKEMLDNKEEIILLDARNDYEYKLGKFENSITLPIKNYKDFPKHVKSLEPIKSKKIVMYCTGGVRCEKSSAFLKENGFNDVSQLNGGVINFINKFPNTYFKGGLFVFDDRIVSQSKDSITECKHCGEKTDICINCHNLDCDKLFICCDKCQKKFDYCCSLDCKNAERHRPKPCVML